MTQDIGEHLRKLTSRNGRYWLRDSRDASASEPSSQDDLPFRSVNKSNSGDRALMHESVVVSIPNVAALNAQAAGIVDTAALETAHLQRQASVGYQLAEKTRVVAPLPKVHQIPPAPNAETVSRAASKLAALAPVNLKSTHFVDAPPVDAAPKTGFAELDVQELPPAAVPFAPTESIPKQDWQTVEPQTVETTVEPESVPKSDDAVEAARASQSKSSSDSIAKIADEIVAKHPLASPSIIMFAGSQASLHADETCARVAAELASRKLGNLLLVDSDFVGRRLTKASGMSSQGGLSEVMNIALPWEKAILKSGSSKLDFMAAGSCPHKRWTPKETIRQALAEIRCSYQFVCVSVGDAHSSAGALWAELSDSAFLVVSASHSSDVVAESAVEQLRENGARMAGCIVADVPAEMAAA